MNFCKSKITHNCSWPLQQRKKINRFTDIKFFKLLAVARIVAEIIPSIPPLVYISESLIQIFSLKKQVLSPTYCKVFLNVNVSNVQSDFAISSAISATRASVVYVPTCLRAKSVPTSPFFVLSCQRRANFLA